MDAKLLGRLQTAAKERGRKVDPNGYMQRVWYVFRRFTSRAKGSNDTVCPS